ncbi:MAG: shikimate kinase [Cryomorphaceae bacterium]
MMGVGKTTLAKKLANLAHWKHIDLDLEIEKLAGMPVFDIFEAEGQQGFRSIEQRALNECSAVDDAVISVGGGTPAFYDNASQMLRSGLCVWLDAPVGMLAQRLKHAKVERPLLSGLTEDELLMRLNELMDERRPYYSQAHMILSMNNLSVQQAAETLSGIILRRS